MEKVKNSIIAIILSLIMLFGGIMLSACGENNISDEIALSDSEVTMVLNVEEQEKEITVRKSSSSFSLFYKISNTEVVSVSTLEQSALYDKYIIKPLSEGDCTITFISKENSSVQGSVLIHVERRLEQISFEDESDIYVAQYGTYQIKGSEATLYPQVNLFEQVDITLEDNLYGLKIVNNRIIDATNVQTNCRVKLIFTSRYNSEIKAEKYVSVIAKINPSTSVELVDSVTNNVYYTLGEQTKDIELVKSSDSLSYKILNINIAGSSPSLLTYSSYVDGISVQAITSGGQVTLQSVNIGESYVHIFVVQTRAIAYFEPVEIVLKVNVIELPTKLLLNGAEITNEVHHVYDYYDEGYIGLPFSVQAYPSAVEDNNDLIQLTFDSADSFKLLKKIGSSVEEVDISSGSTIIKGSDELYLRAQNIESLSQTNFVVTAKSVLAISYGLDVEAQINLSLKKGVQEVIVQDEIRLKVGQSTDILEIGVTPENADTSGISLRTSSNAISAVKLSSNTYKITANKVTNDIQYVYFSKPNGDETVCRVVVFEELSMLNIDIEDELSGKVSQKTYVSGELSEAVVKMGEQIHLFINMNEGATISSIKVDAQGVNGIAFGRDFSYFVCNSIGTFTVQVRVDGYDAVGEETFLTKTFTVQSYKAITSFGINKSNAVCYTADTVGYFKESELSVVDLSAIAYPLDARFAHDIVWSVTDESGADVSSIGSLTYNGSHATFKANQIDTDVFYVIVKATITQFMDTYTVNCRVQISKALQVESIIATNVANQNLYFDSRAGLNKTNYSNPVNTYTVTTAVYPTSALNKNVRYEYRDQDGNMTSDIICSVTDDGLIVPLKAGKCQIWICAEDSYTSSTYATTLCKIYVTVQDGRSLDTAFHITNADELIAIGKDASSMSYYYIVTQNINMANTNFEPFKLPFTGYLTGRMTYTIGSSLNAEENVEEVRYYSIYNINLTYTASTTDVENVYIGMFSSIAVNTQNVYDGMPECGQVKDLTIGYSSVNLVLNAKGENTTNYYFGGVAGYANLSNQSITVLSNVKVAYSSFKASLGVCTTYIGGLLGFVQKAGIEYFNGNKVVGTKSSKYECLGAVVYGSTMQITQREGNATYYIGGIAGYANDVSLKSRFNGIENNGKNTNAQYSSSFVSDFIDVTINIAEDSKITSERAYIGGAFGMIYGGTISNFAVENVLYGYNNIGGLAGATNGNVTISNCFANAKIVANKNIGGFIGQVESGTTSINLSYIQNYDDGEVSDFQLTQLSGVNNIGGFVGLVQTSLSLNKCYTASYITRLYNSTGGFRGDIVAQSQDAKVGGLVGYAENASNVSINNSYTNYMLYVTYTDGTNTSVSRGFRFIAKNGANITNSYIVNENYGDVDFYQDIENTFDNTFYAYFIGGKVTFIFSNGTYTANSKEEILKSDLLSYIKESESEEQIYILEDGQIPYLYHNGYSLVELSPTSIEAISPSGARSDILNVDGEKVLVLEYYKALDSSKQLNIKNLNKVAISSYVDMLAIPQDGYAKRYIVTSSNSNILQVTSDGYFVINAIGSSNMSQVEVVIKSRLNYAKQDKLNIVIIYATSGFGLYDNGAYQSDKMTEISLYKSTNARGGEQIYPVVNSYVYNKDSNNSIEMQNTNNIFVEYRFNNDDYATYVDIVSDKLYNQIHTIRGVEQTKNLSSNLTFTPYAYILVATSSGEHKVYLKDVFKSDVSSYTSPSVKVTVKLGATDIYVVGALDLYMVAGSTATTTLRVHTSDAEENINFGIYNSSNEQVAYYDGSNFVSEKTFNVTDDVVTSNAHYENGNLMYIDYTISVSLKGRARDISKDATYTVRVNPTTNRNLMSAYFVTYYPASVDRIESSYYTYGLKETIGDKSYLNSNESARDMILPGTNGMLIIDVSPYYSNYDYIEVTSENKLSFTQNTYNPYASSQDVPAGKKAYPYADYTLVSYLSSGIRLANIYYEKIEDQVKLQFGKTGRYYVSVNAPVDTLIKTYTIKITAYKVINGTATIVKTAEKTLACENLPVVKLAYRGESSSDVQDIYIPKGVTDKLDVQIYNAVSEPVIKITSATQPDVAYNFMSVYKLNNEYYISINKNAGVGDNVVVTFTCTKRVGEEIKVTTSSIQFIIVPYIIEDLGFSLVSDNVMHEQFGGNFKLALSVENSTIFYDSSDKAIYEQIVSDFAKVSGYDYNTWYAYRSSSVGKDYSIGSYYANDYLTIKTLSSISKDLYISGNFYDEFDSYKKYIGVHLKYYFDKSSNCYVFSKLVKSTENRNATSPFTFSSSKTVQSGRYYFEQSKFFNVSFYMNTSLNNAKPIYNVQEFQEMEDGMSYILMRNLELNNFVPITAQIAYLNGNNKTITLSSFNTENASNIGIFAQTGTNTIIENLNVVIAQRKLYVDAQNKPTVIYGTIVANNFGTLYNCSISYTGDGIESDTIKTTDTSSGTITGTTDYVSSDSIIPTSAFGIVVQITVSDSETSSVTSTMGALCGVNAGYITNCRVNATKYFDFNAYGVVGGLAGQNNGTISSSYSNARVNSYTTVQSSSAVGGFVGRNAGKITLSYVEHKSSYSTSASGIYSGTNVGINSSTTASGFVHTNTGDITNCYSNLKVSTSASSAGFVFDNSNGNVDNCYSACAIRENSKRDMAFVGVNSYNQVNNDNGSITNSYFMRGNFANQDEQEASPVEALDFAKSSTFTSFAFSSKTYALPDLTDTGLSVAGVWMLPKQASGVGDFVGQTFIANMPTLSSANLISRGYVDLLSTSKGDDGNPEYKYSALIGGNLGSSNHPYVIYDTAMLNEYIKEGSSNQNSNTKHYILAKDIEFKDDAKMAETYFTDFKGLFNGNGMSMSNLRISYVNVEQSSLDMKNFGLFKTLNDGAVVQNLDINVSEVYGSAIQNVGVLAGTISNSYIYNINLTGKAVVQGKNIVGALCGVVGAYTNGEHANDNSEIKNITSTLKVNATYKQVKGIEVGDNVASYDKYSYAGGIFGLIASNVTDLDASIAKDIANLSVLGGACVIGDVVGGVCGYIGDKRIINYAEVVVDDEMYLSGTTAIGGIAGVSEGTINYASVTYTDEVQKVLDNVSSVHESGSKANVGKTQDISNNNFFMYNRFGSYSQYGVIGGLVGILPGGVITDSYNKVNVVNSSARILAGLVGNTLGGKISYSYASCIVDGANRSNSSEVRLLGGLVGLNGVNINDSLKYDASTKFSTEQSKTLVLEDVVSLATFNKASYLTYKYEIKTASETLTYYPLIIGGVIGACDGGEADVQTRVKMSNVFYNNYAYDGFNANYKVTSSDMKLSVIGAFGNNEDKSEKFGTYLFAIANMLVKNGADVNIDGANGYLYVQLVSDGKKKVQGDYYTYEPFGSGADSVIGKKTEVFAKFIIDDNFVFDFEDDIAPVIKQVQSPTTLANLFTLDGDNIYLQGSDLYKIALIVKSSKQANSNWTNINGFYGYTLILNADIVLNNIWQGIDSFKGAINGAGHAISFKHVDNNAPLIVNANGATLKNLAITNFALNNAESNKNYGLIATGTNVALDVVSCHVRNANINLGSCTNTSAGIFVGFLKGKYNSINNSYVVFDDKIDYSGLGAFIGTSQGSVKVQSSYALNSHGGTQSINLIASLKDGYTAELANTVLLNNGTVADFVGQDDTTGGVATLYCYSQQDAIINVGGVDISIFKDDSYWFFNGVNQSPFKASIWNLEKDIPVHNFDKQTTIIYDGIGVYNESTRTYTLHNSLNLYNLAIAINNGTLENGGDGYTFKLDADINGMNYALIDGEYYYIYDYGMTSAYILYSNGMQYELADIVDVDGVKKLRIGGTDTEPEYVTVKFSGDAEYNKDESIPTIGTEARPFRGIFDGNMHQISNITFMGFVSSTHIGYAGVFGKTQDATIKNVIFNNITVTLNAVDVINVYAGGVVGLAYASEINCVSFGYIHVESATQFTVATSHIIIQTSLSDASDANFKELYKGNIYLGGLVGFAQTVTIKNVFVNSTYSGATSVAKAGHVIGYLIRNQAFISNINCDVEKCYKDSENEYPELNISEAGEYPKLDYISAVDYYGEIIRTNNDVYDIYIG